MIIHRVLLVASGDEDRSATTLLRRAGYEVEKASCRRSVADRARTFRPDVIVLDGRTHCCSAVDLCRAIRDDAELSQFPLVVLSDSASDTDTVLALELGADDYIAMPVSPTLLCARIAAVLRRSASDRSTADTFDLGHGLAVQPGRAAIVMDGTYVTLTPIELKILSLLARTPQRVFAREAILEELHTSRRSKPHIVDVWIASLRKKLRWRRECIETVRGAGYRFRTNA